MKRLVLAILVAAASLSAAHAADMKRRPAPAPTRTPASFVPAYNWSGLYAGINGGGGWGHSTIAGPLTSGGIDTHGGVFGGTLGYNHQVGRAVFGVEGDVDWSNLKGSAPCAAGVSCEAKNDWMGTARGRIGYAFDSLLPYMTGGLAVGDVKTAATGLGSTASTKAGWTLGGGVEAALAGPWTAKVEYLYVDLEKASAPLGSTNDFRTSLVRGGLNYRF